MTNKVKALVFSRHSGICAFGTSTFQVFPGKNLRAISSSLQFYTNQSLRPPAAGATDSFWILFSVNFFCSMPCFHEVPVMDMPKKNFDTNWNNPLCGRFSLAWSPYLFFPSGLLTQVFIRAPPKVTHPSFSLTPVFCTPTDNNPCCLHSNFAVPLECCTSHRHRGIWTPCWLNDLLQEPRLSPSSLTTPVGFITLWWPWMIY